MDMMIVMFISQKISVA